MYAQFSISDDLRDRLEQLEEDIDAPIRVMTGAYNGEYSGAASRQWLAGQNPDDRDVSNGVTVFDWTGRTSPGGQYNADRLPMALFTNNDDIRYDPSGDVLNAPDDFDITVPLEVGGVIIGEIEARNVYLYHSFSSMQDANQYPIDWTFLTDAIQRSLEPELLSGIEERRIEALREGMREFYERQGQGVLREVRARVDDAEGQLQAYDRHRRSSRDLLNRLRQEATALEEQSRVPIDERLSEVDKLLEHPRLTRVDFRAGQLHLTTTRDIILGWPQRNLERWLGAFEIVLGSEGGFSIEFHNLDTERSGRDHPHVPNGIPCLGDHDPLFHQLWTEGELVSLVELCIQYLETFNENDDYGRYGAQWFEQPDANPNLVTEEVTA